MPQLDFQSHPMAEWTRAVDDATLVILMIETPAAVENLDQIAAVPGFDVLLVGTNDLCIEMGIPGQPEHPRVVSAFERLVAACRAHGKYAGLGGVYEPRLIQRYVELGFRLVLAGNDLPLLLAAAKERAATVRATALPR